MRDWKFFRFIRASGKIGGGSVIFALFLFAIAIWEHRAGKNVPASVLVGSGVTSFCYGCYLAWLKDLQEKEAVLTSIESPKLELTLSGWTMHYECENDKTVFFLASSVLNKGHQTSIVRWSVVYHYGSDIEYPEMPHLNDAYTVVMGDQHLTFTNENLITVKCREKAIGKGELLDGRILFTLPRDRRSQQQSGIVKVVVACFDFLDQKDERIFVPSSLPLSSLLKTPREHVTRVVKDKSEYHEAQL
jgi:hypothetical protein